MTTDWHTSHLSAVKIPEHATMPAIEPGDLHPIQDGRYYWDQSPVVDRSGNIARHRGFELWIALSAPVTDFDAARHEQARLRLLTHRERRWIDCGNLLPDGFCSGSREWAGVALLNDADAITLYYTATGVAGERAPTYTQRIFEASGKLVAAASTPRIDDWTDLGEPIRADGTRYQAADQLQGEPGSIRAFRDPYHFRDPATADEYLLFSASDARAMTERNAAIGIATADPATNRWALENPLIRADGVTNEMERPHVVYRGGNYYLFWSTHGWTFADDIRAPTGLYGMVAESLHGPYEPLNGTGLVAANPADQPYQAYSWLVASDLSVSSFVDMLDGRIDAAPDSPRYPVGKFEGTIAPPFELQLQGARTSIVTGNDAPVC